MDRIRYDVDLVIKRGVKDKFKVTNSRPTENSFKNRVLESQESQRWFRKLSLFYKIYNEDARGYLSYLIHRHSLLEPAR